MHHEGGEQDPLLRLLRPLRQVHEEVDFFEKRGSVPKGEVSEVFLRARDTGNWKSISNITVVEEEGVYTAYERPPEGAKVLNLEGILADFKDKVRRDGS